MLALTGATGFVGSAVLDEAARQGEALRALTRKDQPPRDGVEWLKGDLANTEALARLVTGVEAVIHIAGVTSAPDPEGFEEGNVRGTLRLVEAAVKAGVPRFVHVSSLSAREPDLSAYGASKRRAEQIVMASGLDWTMVRPPAVYGPRDTETLDLFRAAKWGVVPMPPPGKASLIHVADLARLLLALVPTGEDVTGMTFEPDDGRKHGWSHRELALAVGWAMGRKPWVPHLSAGSLKAAARLDSWLRGGKAKLTPDRARYLAHPDWTIDRAKFPPVSRWQPKVDPRDGLKETAAWYRENGWV